MNLQQRKDKVNQYRKEELPDWLRLPVESMTDQEAQKLNQHLRSWLTVWYSHDKWDEVTLARLIFLELTGKNRSLVLKRLKHWYNEARDRKERASIPALANA